ncbi:MAG: hypothetical protein ISS82_04630 [Nanoarchaeota archaeon]|nr:hypothetical protein [Nanoarchaeota archaeon]
MVKATIKDVKIYDVLDLWRRKPRQLKFDDTDVIVVTTKVGKKEVKETFFTCIKPDGTFNIETPNRVSRARRKKLVDFLKHYKFTKNPKDYNLKENIKQWKGKKVEVDKEGYILIL